MRATSQQPPTEIFKALSDPIRWNIVLQMASVDELACVTLEDSLPVSKPTISYHIKTLYQAGLINVRKSGRNYFYSLRRESCTSCSTTCGSWHPRSDRRRATRTGSPGPARRVSVPAPRSTSRKLSSPPGDVEAPPRLVPVPLAHPRDP